MKAKSICGRVLILPFFAAITVSEFLCSSLSDKFEQWHSILHKKRISIQKWSDEKLPLQGGKKTNL